MLRGRGALDAGSARRWTGSARRSTRDPEALDRLIRAPAFRRRFRELTPEAVLTRMPRGYAESHAAAGWLRYQSFTASRDLTEREVLSPRLPDMLARDFAALVPLVRWLNQAIGYPSRDRRF